MSQSHILPWKSAKCNVSWRTARQYNSGPKMKRKQAFFHDASTFLPFFSTEAWRVCVFLQAWGLFGDFLAWARPEALRRPKNPKKGRRPAEKHKLWELKLKKRQKSGQILKACFLFICGLLFYWRAVIHEYTFSHYKDKFE